MNVCYEHAERALGRFLPHITGRAVAVQAGGAVGYVPRLLARHFETVYTFEPVMQVGELPENVVLIREFLGDGRPVSFVEDAERSRVTGWGVTPTFRLEDLGERIDFLWLDIEGSEVRALDGLGDLPPAVAVEHKRKPRFFEQGDAVEWLERRGYRYADSFALDRLYLR